jgi:hypothetical protein
MKDWQFFGLLSAIHCAPIMPEWFAMFCSVLFCVLSTVSYIKGPK